MSEKEEIFGESGNYKDDFHNNTYKTYTKVATDDETKNKADEFVEAYKKFEQIRKQEILKTGNVYLDNLLQGGIRRGLVHLIIGNSVLITNILLKTAVNALKPDTVTTIVNTEYKDAKTTNMVGIARVAYIDGTNRYNPYYISQLALSMKLNPSFILPKILIARAFNWSQMVEILQRKIANLQGIRLIIIDGITTMFPLRNINNTYKENYKLNNNVISSKPFNEMKKALSGIKRLTQQYNPFIIISAPRHPNSLHKPVGGKLLSHFGCVIIEIIESKKYVNYILAQHPFFPPKRVVKWKNVENMIMDKYMKWRNDDESLININCISKNRSLNNCWKEEINPISNLNILKEVIRQKTNLKRENSKRKKRNRKNERSSLNPKNLTLDFFLQS
ncbi:MAG: hypothetical protein ACTSRZ_03535 [Promethearchaeota archaeon]